MKKTTSINENDIQLLDDKIQPRLTVCVHGRTKHGKTQFALTAPGDLGIISLDVNCKPVAKKYLQNNPESKNIHVAEFMRSALSQIEDINNLKAHWNKVRDAHYKMLDMKSIRTIIWDTHTQMWEDCKLAYVGREKPDLSAEVDAQGNPTGKKFSTRKTMPRDLGEAKRDIREMINACGDKNLVILCTAKDVWTNDVKTTDIERVGMPGVEYLSQCEVMLFRDALSGEYVGRILGSTANSDLRGRPGTVSFQGKDIWRPSEDELVGEEINFAMVGWKVFPELTEYEDWL